MDHGYFPSVETDRVASSSNKSNLSIADVVSACLPFPSLAILERMLHRRALIWTDFLEFLSSPQPPARFEEREHLVYVPSTALSTSSLASSSDMKSRSCCVRQVPLVFRFPLRLQRSLCVLLQKALESKEYGVKIQICRVVESWISIAEQVPCFLLDIHFAEEVFGDPDPYRDVLLSLESPTFQLLENLGTLFRVSPVTRLKDIHNDLLLSSLTPWRTLNAVVKRIRLENEPHSDELNDIFSYQKRSSSCVGVSLWKDRKRRHVSELNELLASQFPQNSSLGERKGVSTSADSNSTVSSQDAMSSVNRFNVFIETFQWTTHGSGVVDIISPMLADLSIAETASVFRSQHLLDSFSRCISHLSSSAAPTFVDDILSSFSRFLIQKSDLYGKDVAESFLEGFVVHSLGVLKNVVSRIFFSSVLDVVRMSDGMFCSSNSNTTSRDSYMRASSSIENSDSFRAGEASTSFSRASSYRCSTYLILPILRENSMSGHPHFGVVKSDFCLRLIKEGVVADDVCRIVLQLLKQKIWTDFHVHFLHQLFLLKTRPREEDLPSSFADELASALLNSHVIQEFSSAVKIPSLIQALASKYPIHMQSAVDLFKKLLNEINFPETARRVAQRALDRINHGPGICE